MPVRWTLVLAVVGVLVPATLLAQNVVEPTTDTPPPGEMTAPEPSPAPAFFFSAGGGYGLRFDPCAQCTSAENVQSFTGHVSVGTYLWKGLGVGVEASVWRRGHPGVPTTGVPVEGEEGSGGLAPTTLVNQLTNVSLSFSYQVWHVFAHAGGGFALARQDVQAEDDTVSRGVGKGVGYSFGGGIMLPIAGPASLMFYGDWNHGRYDLATPETMLARGVTHDYAEMGFGITIR